MGSENGESKMEDYEIVEQIGKGPIGTTFLVLHHSLHKKYVLKKIPLAKQTEKFKRTAHQEMMNLMTKLNHPYIVEIKDAWIDKGTHLCVVTDYCEGDDMTEIMKKTKGKRFSEEKLCKWMTQLLLAVDYLHSNRIVHGDLKSSNIILTKENDIRIGGFGFAKLLIAEDSLPSAIFNRKIVGVPPPNFMCPELLENIPFGYKSDMWSLGCCMFVMAAQQPAFKAPDMAELINNINRSLISPLPIVYSSTLKQIIKTMLRKTPEHRPTAADLLRHPHLQPFLLLCHNPAPVFLPVFPSPKDKPRRRLSSNGSISSKENGETDPIPKTFENSNTPHILVKKVDFTSYSPSVSNNSDASSSKDITTCDLFVSPKIEDTSDDNFQKQYLISKKEDTSDELIPLNGENDENLVHMPEDSIAGDSGTCELDATSCELISREEVNLYQGSSHSLEIKSNFLNEEVTIAIPEVETEEQERISPANTKDFQQPEEIIEVLYETEEKVQNCSDGIENGEVRETVKNVKNLANEKRSDGSSLSDSNKQRADALESLLELCAKLLKHDKLEELASVLKPFGEEAVSSRETTIWLTKSLIKYSSP